MIIQNKNEDKNKIFYNKEELIKNFNKKENEINIDNYYVEDNEKYKPTYLLIIIGYYITLFIIDWMIYTWMPLIMMILTFIILWTYSLLSIIKNDFKKDNNKIVWILLLFFFPISIILYPDFEKIQIIKK